MTKTTILLAGALAAIVAGCAATAMRSSHGDISEAQVLDTLKASFRDKGQAKLDRLNQDDLQRRCSEAEGKPLAKDVAERVEKAEAANLRYPEGSLLGDWKSGEKIAQSGVGKQYTDDPSVVAGGNCYACHQLTPQELAYGTIGPSLRNFGKTRGNTPQMQRYVYGKIFDPDAFSACSSMPRFGHNGILDEKQIKDVTALLLDPNSPVNQ